MVITKTHFPAGILKATARTYWKSQPLLAANLLVALLVASHCVLPNVFTIFFQNSFKIFQAQNLPSDRLDILHWLSRPRASLARATKTHRFPGCMRQMAPM